MIVTVVPHALEVKMTDGVQMKCFLPVRRHMILAMVIGLSCPAPVLAGHFPWDQGHDTFKPDPGQPADPGPCLNNARGSPLEVATGNSVFEWSDLAVPGVRPRLSVRRTYNSMDMRSGPFGRGWSHSYDVRLIPTTDGEQLYLLCRQGNGRRDRFIRRTDGSYQSPPAILWSVRQNADGTFTVSQPDGKTGDFDEDGRLLRVTDGLGRSLEFEYDATGFLTKVSDGRGRSLSFTKGPDGKVHSVRDPAGRVVQYEYDDAGNLVSFSSPSGVQQGYVYDASQRLVEVTSSDGALLLSFAYDERGRLSEYEAPDDGAWSIEYVPQERRTVRRNTAGSTFTYHYDDSSNIVRLNSPGGTTFEYMYSDRFDVTHVVVGGDTCSIERDEVGRVTRIVDTSGQVREYSYDPTSSLLLSYKDAGASIDFDYDASGNLTVIRDADGDSVRLYYDREGVVSAAVNPSGRRIEVSPAESLRAGAPYLPLYDAARHISLRAEIDAWCEGVPHPHR